MEFAVMVARAQWLMRRFYSVNLKADQVLKKGKPAIAVSSLEKLPSVIDTLITEICNWRTRSAACGGKQASDRKSPSEQRDNAVGSGVLFCSPLTALCDEQRRQNVVQCQNTVR
jgi:hypothetical protein